MPNTTSKPIDLSKEIALINGAISAIGKNIDSANMQRVIEHQKTRVYKAALSAIAAIDANDETTTSAQLVQHAKDIANRVLTDKKSINKDTKAIDFVETIIDILRTELAELAIQGRQINFKSEKDLQHADVISKPVIFDTGGRTWIISTPAINHHPNFNL